MTQGHITAMSHFGATWHGSLYSAGRLYASLLNETLLRQEFPVQIQAVLIGRMFMGTMR